MESRARCERTALLAAERSTGSAAVEREKQTLREAMAARRAACSRAQRAATGSAVAAHVLALCEFASAHTVVLYAALADEVPLDAVADAVLASDRILALPRMQGDRLRFARVEQWRALVHGRFGILEPPGAAPDAALDDGDLVLLPGVAFDAQGGRLGRGGGIYDRAIAALGASPRLVGVGFGFQWVARVPMAAHDRRVDAFVCERGVTRCPRRDPPGDSS